MIAPGSESLADHVRSPYHLGDLPSATHEGVANSLVCGDRVRLQLRVERDAIVDAWFIHRGCAVSLAGGSALCSSIEGQPLARLSEVTDDIFIAGFDVPFSRMRKGCVLLALRALGNLTPLPTSDLTDSISLLSGRPPKLVLLDRDDTLIRVPAGRRYLYGDDAIEFLSGAVDFIRRCNAAAIPVAVVTNQQGVALADYPDMTLASVERFHERLRTMLAEQGTRLDRIYVCPHAKAENCGCRKPKPGMILQALRDFGVSGRDALLIGDSERDIAAAAAAGTPAAADRPEVVHAALRTTFISGRVFWTAEGVVAVPRDRRPQTGPFTDLASL